jgi:NAD-dependent DNA ligase
MNKEKRISELEDIILFHKYLYYERAEPIISDYEYDKLERELRDLCPKSKILDEYIECPRKLWPKYEKKYNKIKYESL